LISLKNNLKDNAVYESCTKKFDLAIWTLNSAKTLPFALMSIEKAIPREYVNQKIMVDGHSIDETRNIGKAFGWNVIGAEKTGIPNQANQALKLVKTEFFASFEHDIILSRNWFPAILNRLLANPDVAVAQGVRVSTNPIFKKIEEAYVERNLRYTSIDNALYRTELIKSLGGFNVGCPISCDYDLQERVLRAGYKWVVDKTVISTHLRGTIRQSAKHAYTLSEFASYHDKLSFSSVFSRFLFSPIRGVEISLKKNCPQAVVVYPYWRFVVMKSMLKIPANKSNQNKKSAMSEGLHF